MEDLRKTKCLISHMFYLQNCRLELVYTVRRKQTSERNRSAINLICSENPIFYNVWSTCFEKSQLINHNRLMFAVLLKIDGNDKWANIDEENLDARRRSTYE